MAKEMKMTKVEDNSAGTRAKRGVLTVVINFLLWVFSLTCIFPLVWMLYSSLKEKRQFNADIVGLPTSPTLSNYVKILSNKDYKLMQSVGNSARTTILSVLLIVLIAFIVGYILSRIDFALNKPLYVMFLMGMLIPIHSLMVPIYIIFSKAGISNHWYTLLLPVCKPILVTVAIINVFSCWNEFSFALILIKDRALYTVPLGLKQFTGQFTSDYPKIMAAMLMTMAPIVIFYFAFSKQIIKGMVAGAEKLFPVFLC